MRRANPTNSKMGAPRKRMVAPTGFGVSFLLLMSWAKVMTVARKKRTVNRIEAGSEGSLSP